MKKRYQNYLFFLSIILALNLLSACSLDSTASSGSSADSSVVSQTDSDDNSAPSEALSNNASSETASLAINTGCCGCGKCVQIDPEHFAFDSNGDVAVISLDNLDSVALARAIASCRHGAIDLG